MIVPADQVLWRSAATCAHVLYFGCFVTLLGVVSPSLRAVDVFDDLSRTEREWVSLRVESARLETAWREERGLVESTLAALKERAVQAEEKRDLVRAKTAQDREELETLRTKTRSSAADVKACDDHFQALAAKLIALRPSLPPRLSEALEMSYRSLAERNLAPAERIQLVANVLNRCMQFNHLITTGQDVLTLAGEPAPKSLDVVYWGLSHGYAIDRASHKAWLGAPASDGWRWAPVTGAFDRVEKLIAIAADKADPEFMTVPAPAVKLTSGSTTGASP